MLNYAAFMCLNDVFSTQADNTDRQALFKLIPGVSHLPDRIDMGHISADMAHISMWHRI